jgi:hypothetical protein
MNDSAMTGRFSADIQEHDWRSRDNGSSTESAYHRLAATCPTSGTCGGVMVDEEEGFIVVHSGFSVQGAGEWSSRGVCNAQHRFRRVEGGRVDFRGDPVQTVP